MNPITSILNKYQLMILDGALATELEKFECDLNDPLWSAKILMENPSLIKKVHMNYFEAGADCAITASYQATVEGFKQRGLDEQEAEKLIRNTVQLAAEARDDFWLHASNRENRPRPIIAASVGPYGAYLADGSEYRGNYGRTEQELIDFHRPRVKALVEAGADILALETIPCFIEAKAFVTLMKEFPEQYIWVSFSAGSSTAVNSGENIRDCAAWLDNYEQVAAVGVNCTPVQYISSLIEEIKISSDKPIIVYPNSGETYDADTHSWKGNKSQEDFSVSAHRWFTQGAKIIGGCCRTGPEDIRAIRRWAVNL